MKARSSDAGRRGRPGRSRRTLWLWCLLFVFATLAFPQSVFAGDVDTDRPVSSYAPRGVEKISWFRRHFRKVSWDEAVRSCETPSDVCNIVGSQLRYESESREKWTGARETWEKRSGDCEDFAIAVVEMCRELGIEAWVELYFPAGPTPGHAVAVGRWKGSLWVSSIGGYEEVSSKDEIDEIVAAMLWCRVEGMWKAVMDYDAILRRIQQTRSS